MKAKTLKLLALIVALAMTFVMFAGCGGSSDTAETTEAPAASEATPAPETGGDETPAEAEPADTGISYPIADDATLTSWGSINANLSAYMDSLSDNAVIQKAAEITGVTLEATSVSSDAVSESFAIMISSGDYTDYIDNVASFYSSVDAAIDDGILVDLSDVIQENAPDYYGRLLTDDDWLRCAYTDDGKMGLFLKLTEDANALRTNGYIIRKDWLDDLGLDVPTTRDELYTALTAFKNEKGASAPLWYNSNGLGLISESYGVMATYEPMGGYYPFIVVDGEVLCGYQQDTFKDYLASTAQWYSEGLIWKDFMSDTFCFGINTSNALSLFTTGDMGVAYGEAKDVATLADQADDPNYTLVAMPDPTLDGSPNKITALDTGIGYKYGISTSCENVELACQYLNFFYTDEGYELCTYGIEGQASVNGEYTELLTNNDQGLSFDNAFEIYCLADFPCLADGTRYARIYDETTLEACDTWAACADGSYAYPKAATLTADESDEFNGYFTDIKTYVSESILGFITGSLSIEDDWDTFQQQLVDMHINDALSIKAAAYERYIRK